MPLNGVWLSSFRIGGLTAQIGDSHTLVLIFMCWGRFLKRFSPTNRWQIFVTYDVNSWCRHYRAEEGEGACIDKEGSCRPFLMVHIADFLAYHVMVFEPHIFVLGCRRFSGTKIWVITMIFSPCLAS